MVNELLFFNRSEEDVRSFSYFECPSYSWSNLLLDLRLLRFLRLIEYVSGYYQWYLFGSEEWHVNSTIGIRIGRLFQEILRKNARSIECQTRCMIPDRSSFRFLPHFISLLFLAYYWHSKCFEKCRCEQRWCHWSEQFFSFFFSSRNWQSNSFSSMNGVEIWKLVVIPMWKSRMSFHAMIPTVIAYFAMQNSDVFERI